MPTTRIRHAGTMCAAAAICIAFVAGCGTRVNSGSQPEPSITTSTTTAATSASKFGTLPAPCGPGTATGATDVGLSSTTIRIGVITDTNAGAIRVPTAGIEPSMKAFVHWCNALGGINGRKLDLITYDSQLFNMLPTMKQACDDHLFALVGSGSALDAPGAQPMIDCGLVAVSGYTASYEMGLSPNVVTPVPNPGNRFSTVGMAHIIKTHPEAVKRAAIFYPGGGSSTGQAERFIAAGKKLGMTFVYQGTYPAIETDWPTQIQVLKNKHVGYVTTVDTVTSAIQMLQAMSDANYHPVVDLGIQAYDTSLPASGVANGVYVQDNTQPFEDPNPAINEYLAQLKDVSNPPVPTTLGVQAFSAGLLFAVAAQKLGSHLTRTSLLTTLHGIHQWDGGGLHPTQNPGSNLSNPCVVYMTVKNNKFVRSWPAKGFACDPKGVMVMTGHYGVIPKAK